jgi:Fe-S cluster biogenesis protein NfuA
MDATPVDSGIARLRSLIVADGGDLEMRSWDPASGEVRIRLVLEDAACRECVMPLEFLEPIALDMLSSAEPAVRSVVIDDPRVST